MRTRTVGAVLILSVAYLAIFGFPKKYRTIGASASNTLGDAYVNSIGMKLVYIPPGEFMMGSPTSEKYRFSDESQHKKKISKGFYLGAMEVSQKQWKAVMGTMPCHNKGDDLPVEMICWDRAVEFCRKLSDTEGIRYRLPTEAEWEYACRAGTSTPFNTGETIDTDKANYQGEDIYPGGKKGIYRRKTTPVGSFPPNAWGLYDMHGNVWEYCDDIYAPYQATLRDRIHQIIYPAENRRVSRGGAYCNFPWVCRSASRCRNLPSTFGSLYGFRVAAD